MLSGPHKYLSGNDTGAMLLKQLVELTEHTFRANKKRGILLDCLIERVVGPSPTEEECRAEKLKLVQRLRMVSATGRRTRGGS